MFDCDRTLDSWGELLIGKGFRLVRIVEHDEGGFRMHGHYEASFRVGSQTATVVVSYESGNGWEAKADMGDGLEGKATADRPVDAVEGAVEELARLASEKFEEFTRELKQGGATGVALHNPRRETKGAKAMKYAEIRHIRTEEQDEYIKGGWEFDHVVDTKEGRKIVMKRPASVVDYAMFSEPEKITRMLRDGWELYGSPTHNGQALVKYEPVV